jgi:hypothetical protein
MSTVIVFGTSATFRAGPFGSAPDVDEEVVAVEELDDGVGDGDGVACVILYTPAGTDG